MQNARDYLTSLYLDYRNNYLTLEKFAEHNGITTDQMDWLLNVAQSVCESFHPDA